MFRRRHYTAVMGRLYRRSMGWLLREWPYAGFLAGLLLLALAPLWVSGMGLVIGVIYFQLPVYMLHQLEEHAGDRFRRFVNDRVADGKDALTPEATLVINVVGVWMVNVIALYLAMYVSPALGLISVYLTLVNAVVHVVGTVVLRAYNPGLWTAIILFLPLGIYSLFMLNSAGAGVWANVLGILVAVAIHAAILVHIRHRIQALSTSSTNTRVS
ncbi:MAG TPA: HXXEE domain-containing protein [Rubrobacter sp.]|nr:HXXEE domain-containing protein [Rubrobacter sp.]